MNNSYLLNYLQQSGELSYHNNRWFGHNRNVAWNIVECLDCWRLMKVETCHNILFLKVRFKGHPVILCCSISWCLCLKSIPITGRLLGSFHSVLRNDALLQQLFDGLKKKDFSNIPTICSSLCESQKLLLLLFIFLLTVSNYNRLFGAHLCHCKCCLSKIWMSILDTYRILQVFWICFNCYFTKHGNVEMHHKQVLIT